jgi:hypothetical protein
MLRRLLPDKFILWLIGAIALAWVAPVSAAPAAAVDWITYAAIFALFFLHGARLPREALVAGFVDVKLHATILLITFGLFPVFGLALALAAPDLFDPMIWTGFLFLCVVPSTVQSSIFPAGGYSTGGSIMLRKIKYLASAAAAAAMLATTPAAAQYGRYQPYDPYYDRRDDGFDIATGIAVVGTIASILNAVRGGRAGYGSPYGYGTSYGYGSPYGQARPYGYSQPYGYGGQGYDYAYSVNNAVNSCGRQAQRVSGGGRVEIRDVDQVSGGRLRVRGVFDDLRNSRPYSSRRIDRDGFSCLTWGDGRIQNFRVN